MNLVICLLSTRQFLTAEKIRESVAGYADSASDEAFSRMFERDKNELRDLGVPLETGQASRFSTVEGYRINRNAYELPDIDLSQEESAAVAVAVQLWESPELTSAAQGHCSSCVRRVCRWIRIRRPPRSPRFPPAPEGPNRRSASCWRRSMPAAPCISRTAAP